MERLVMEICKGDKLENMAKKKNLPVLDGIFLYLPFLKKSS